MLKDVFCFALSSTVLECEVKIQPLYHSSEQSLWMDLCDMKWEKVEKIMYEESLKEHPFL